MLTIACEIRSPHIGSISWTRPTRNLCRKMSSKRRPQMSVNLSTSSFVVAGDSPAPTRLLRQASGVRMLQKCLPLMAYLSSQHSDTPYGTIAQAFLEEDVDLLDGLTWSPVFRSWFSDARHMADWETLTPQHE